MKLQTGTYDAEMGRTGGGVFDEFLKSGTNEYHGARCWAMLAPDRLGGE